MPCGDEHDCVDQHAPGLVGPMDLEPVVLYEEVWTLRKRPHAVGQAYTEADQPLLCEPRGCHEGLFLEQAVDGKL